MRSRLNTETRPQFEESMSTVANIPATASTSRFYQLEMRNRPVLRGDIGSLIRIDGLVVGGGGASAILLLPSAGMKVVKHVSVERLSDEEWTEFLQRSDVPEILIGPAKAFHRKARYEISGLVQQKVWVADNFQCMYCGRKMGDVQLTIDHFIPLELGGANDTSNYLSACRACNKSKGSLEPRIWCKRNNEDKSTDVEFNRLVAYLAARVI
jgi:5-methylcytosine-specific restriction enzyme A